ncbi:MAG: hypothetical protein Q4G51_05255 [Dermatophilus congolensis]|nr:hypothetical protein [Dermatophilus congolensis]
MSDNQLDVFHGEDVAAVTPALEGIEVRDDAEPADAGGECTRGHD